MKQWTETVLSLAIQIGLSDNRHAAILSRTFPFSKVVQSVKPRIFIRKFMARISAEILHGFRGFTQLLKLKNPKYQLNLYHDRCLSHNFTFINYYQQVTRCYNVSVTDGVKVHAFSCYVSNTPSKIIRSYHYFKLIITPTEEIKIR